MSQPTFSSQIETTLQPEMIGQLVVGRHLLSVGSAHGALLNSRSEELPTLEPKPTPLIQVPRAFAGLIGRQTEIEWTIAALQSHQSVEIYGRAGIGKTALLRYLAHHPQVTTSHADGILYLGEHQPVADRLQSLFDAFYNSHPVVRPADAELWQLLKDKQVLLLLDDEMLSTEDIQQLIAALPNSTFLITSQRRRFWVEERAIALEGLPLEESLTLLERTLGRSLTLEQQTAAESICTLLKGHPQRVLQTAALVREDKISFAQVLEQIQLEQSEPLPLQDAVTRSLTRMILVSLPKTQRWIVAALVAMGDIGLLAEQIAAITGPPNPQPSLQALMHRHLIEMHGYRYCLSSSLIEILRDDFNPTPWMERVLAYVMPWAEQHRLLPEALLTEREVLLYSLQWAVEKGRHGEVLRLARSLEATLALRKQWETWQQVLHWALQAAWTIADQTSEAWALHELGTLALCREEVTTAYDAFSQALSLRSTLSNEIGARLTQHNQECLKASTLPTQERSRFLIFGSRVGIYVALGAIVLAVFGVSGWLGGAIVDRLSQPSVGSPTAPRQP